MQDPQKEPGFVRYSVVISESLCERLNQLVMILKNFDDKKISKQKWIELAIEEKIDRDKSLGDVIPIEKQLCIKIKKNTFLDLSRRVVKISKFRPSFSKKKYILEAVYEKLQRDEPKARELLNSAFDQEETNK